MFSSKKSALSLFLVIGMTASTGAYANATANATTVWSGIVPTTSGTDKVIITGLAGDMTALNGTITPDTKGVFETDAIILEAHLNTGDAAAPVVGDLAAANWTLNDASVTYDGKANQAQSVEILINNSPVSVGDSISGEETITAKITQSAQLPEAEVSNTTVQASMTLMADVI
ncbi:hypothetical protein AKJ18_22285 [Vibrio xuii]|nr:hypothetical protein AKJ18_22285 [Vibrio xuii]